MLEGVLITYTSEAALQTVETSAAILVGGRARRFDGRVKSHVLVGGRSILDRQLEAIRGAGIDQVLLVGTWSGERVRGVRHVPDVIQNGGALGGLYSALLAAWTSRVIVLAGDLPFVTEGLVRRLASPAATSDAIVPRDGTTWHPVCAGYRRSVALRLKTRLDRGALVMTEALADLDVQELTADELSEMDAEGMLLMNVNTPDDHERAESMLRARRP